MKVITTGELLHIRDVILSTLEEEDVDMQEALEALEIVEAILQRDEEELYE